jgi:hypothetical protein
MILDTVKELVDIPGIVGVVITSQRKIPVFYLRSTFFSPQSHQALGNCLRHFSIDHHPLESGEEFQAHDFFAYAYPIQPDAILIALVQQPNALLKTIIKNCIGHLKATNLETLIRAFQSFTALGPDLTDVFENELAAPLPQSGSDLEFFAESMTIHEAVEVLNRISQITCHYLGPKLTANFWQLARPQDEWLHQFQMNQNAQLQFKSNGTVELLTSQHRLIQEWTIGFIQRSAEIIKNLTEIIAMDRSSSIHPYSMELSASDGMIEPGESQGLFDLESELVSDCP